MKEFTEIFEYPHKKLMKITCQFLCRSLQMLLISSRSKTVNRLCVRILAQLAPELSLCPPLLYSLQCRLSQYTIYTATSKSWN